MKKVPRVLIVEDDLYYAESIILLLKSAGMSPLISSSLAEAKRTIAKHHPDIAVIDVMLPAGSDKDAIASRGGFTSGLVLAEWIAGQYPETKMIGYSSAGNPEFAEIFERFGGKFLAKLGVDRELVRTIQDLATFNISHVGKVRSKNAHPPIQKHSAKIFIVHGHDDKAKWELKNYIQNTLGLPQPIILHEQPNVSLTIIEKLEDEAEDVGIVFVLLTPDDPVSNANQTNEQKRRARQNVIFEMGFFLGRLGRRTGRVLLLYKGAVELPNDIGGLIYIDISNGIEATGETIRRELRGLV